MAPSAAGHRPIQSFFRAGRDGTTTVGPSSAPEERPGDPQVPGSSAPIPRDAKSWDRSNARTVVAYARRKRGGKGVACGTVNDESDELHSVKHQRVSERRPRDVPGDGADEHEPSTSGAEGLSMNTNNPLRSQPSQTKTKQLFLDLGQKSFGHVTCVVCGLLYAKGEPADETTHAAYHAKHVSAHGGGIVNGKKNERLKKDDDSSSRRVGGLPCPMRWGFDRNCWVNESQTEWISRSTKSDHPRRKEVVIRIVEHVESELGLENGWALQGGEKINGTQNGTSPTVYLYVVGNKITGALVVEQIQAGYRTVVGTSPGTVGDEDSPVLRRGDKPERATLGVRAIWIHRGWRRNGLGKQLLETARHTMTAGYISSPKECSFTQPTESGTKFAVSACARDDGTFLVYG